MPMQSIGGTPHTQRWVPQSEPLDLNEPIGYVHADGPYSEVLMDDLDDPVKHRIESWPGAVALLRSVCACNASDAERIESWLAANATEES